MDMGNNALGSLPVQIGADTNWAASTTAMTLTAAWKTNGTLWTWDVGTNPPGQQVQ
jgi:hypothetical protein